MNRNMCIFDATGKLDDNAIIKGTNIILRNKATGKVIFKGSNKVIASGSEFNSLKCFNFDPENWESDIGFLPTIKSYDEALNTSGHTLDTPTSKTQITNGILAGIGSFTPGDGSAAEKLYKDFSRRVCLFCVGIDGCGIENSRVYKVHNTKWIAPYGYAKYDPGTGIIDPNISNCLIPFQYKSSAANNPKYFGKSTVDGMISYYFKGFDTTPKLIRRYADDSADLETIDDVWKDERFSDAEIVVQLKMSVDSMDCRDYFGATTGDNTARINTISLCTAVPYLDGEGNLVYEDIRPYTKFNFSNEPLTDDTKGIDITYYLYY